MNKSEKHWVYGIALIIVVALAANYMGYTAQFGWPKMFQQTPGGGNGVITPPPSSKDDYANGIGVFSVIVKGFDSADPTTARDPETAFDAEFMHFTGGQWTPDSGVYDVDGTNYYTAKAVDNGYAWIAIKPHASSTTYYMDYQKTRSSDSYITSMMYTDVDGDGTPEFVFQYDLHNHQIPNAGYPVIQFINYVITADTGYSWNTQVNQTGLGTATNQTFTEDYLSGGTVKDGIAFYQFRIKVNTTDDTRVRLMKFQIPGVGTVDGSAFTKQTTDTSIIWTYTISTTLNGADYIVYMPNTVGKLYINFQLQFLLQSSDNIVFIFYADYLQAGTGAGKTITSGALSFKE